ncbi:hypothetical protein ACJRPK_14205 [Aquimarina sp. 2-A2]|uniref:hypothetical protein n=1 Tax=Aquimarina sp. 2-A2 TaxID=3382644 RepID=UPI00387F12B4
MSIQHIIDWCSNNPNSILLYFGAILALTLLVILIVSDANFRYTRYMMSIIVYAVTVPGILAIFLVLYALLMHRINLLEVSVLVYFVPIISMIITLILLNKKVTLSKIPGFDRLSGLMLMISIVFAIVFVLQKTIFGVFFIGGFTQLIIVFVIVFLVTKFAWSRLTK